MLKLLSFYNAIKDKHTSSTVKQYVCCIRQLRYLGITESSTSEEVRDALYEVSEKGSTRMIYIAAITDYEERVMHVKEGLLKGNIRRECIKDSGKEKNYVEPKQSLTNYKRMITNCKNEKVKAYLTLQLYAGMRVSEVQMVHRDDVRIIGTRIWVDVRPENEKTKRGRTIKVLENPKLVEMLEEQFKTSDMPFLKSKSAALKYLRDYGGKSHDLRRHNARIRYIDARKSGLKKYPSMAIVAKQLGHTMFANTRRYLGNVWVNDKGGKYKENK